MNEAHYKKLFFDDTFYETIIAFRTGRKGGINGKKNKKLIFA
jgi:hypothetical protein